MSDPRVRKGLERQLARRSELLAAGHAPLGWKAGFGAPASLERFELDGPLVGFMTDRSVLADGAEVDISSWGRAVAEPELFVVLDGELGKRADEKAARDAIAALGPALELANIQPPPEEVEEVLAGNIFHEAVILGAPDPTRRGGDIEGLEATVTLDDEELHRTSQLEDLTGHIPAVIAHLARLIAAHGERMRPGEVVICGSIVPPLELSGGVAVDFRLDPLGQVSVRAV